MRHPLAPMLLPLTLMAALVGSPWNVPSRGADLPQRPNFIVINIDDLGYGDIEPYGCQHNRTPNLARMAKEGCRLTCFYAAPVCSPSRASLMTGCYPKRALPIPHVLFPGNDIGLSPDEVTLAEVLRERGYATGIIGKWHLGDQPDFLPTRQGFQYYYGLPYSNDMGPASDGVKSNLGRPLPKQRGKGQPPLPLLQNETVLQRVLPDDQQAIVENYTNEAVAFLYRQREAETEQPFFLYLPHSAVHFPLYPGKAFQGKSKHGLFGDWVEEVDWSVGQILAALKQTGFDKNTLVIFTSDNGGQQVHGAVNLPLRGGKGSTWEGGVRVPTIAWWPGQIPAGTETAEITSMMDLLPTFAGLADAKLPANRKLDGGDIWPLLKGDPSARSPHENYLYYRGLNLQAVRSGPWKLHLESGELYHLIDDISEANNVAKDHADVVAKLRGIAESTKNDLAPTGMGPGVRPLGKVNDARPLIDHDGNIRPGFAGEAVYAGQGIMVGEPTDQGALVQVRLTKGMRLARGDLEGAAGVVRLTLHSAAGEKKTFPPVPALDEHDFIARLQLTGLKPGASYQVTTEIGRGADSLRPGPTASFRTLPGKQASEKARLVVVTGMNYAKFHGDNRIDRAQHLLENNTELPAPYSGPDKALGYPALQTIRNLAPNFFVGTGDNVYYDTPDKFRAETTAQMRQKWHEQFVQPRYRQLFAVVPTYWMIDDHDYRIDDGDNSGDYHPTSAEGREMMLEQLPVAPMDDQQAKTYRTHRVTRDLQVWFPENRMYRSPNAMEDGPQKTIWGAEQKAWLKRTLADSDATFKLLISPTPMVGPDDLRKTDNHTDIGGFRHERDEFFAWLKESGIAKQNFYLVCGDRHWQYHSIDPTGLEEFSCGALVDANSRPGRLPGDPKSTDPQARIKQPYSQRTPSGGFLEIAVEPATGAEPARLDFIFRDEQGEVLYKHGKTAAR